MPAYDPGLTRPESSSEPVGATFSVRRVFKLLSLVIPLFGIVLICSVFAMGIIDEIETVILVLIIRIIFVRK